MSNSASMHFVEPWHAMDASRASSFVAELQRELSPDNPLFEQPVAAVACRFDCDDVLFRFGASPERFAVVHLTWSGKRETSRQGPSTELFDTLDEFAERRMKQDAFEYDASANPAAANPAIALPVESARSDALHRDCNPRPRWAGSLSSWEIAA